MQKNNDSFRRTIFMAAVLVAVLFVAVLFMPQLTTGSLVAANTRQGGYNLLRNPGFDDGVLEPWHGIDVGGIFIRRYSNTPSYYAEVAVRDRNKGASINQDVVFNESGTFEFSAKVWCDRNKNQEIRVVVWELGGGGSDNPTEEAFYTDDSQRTFKVRVNKSRPRSKLRVEVYPDRHTPLTFYVDNARLIKVD